MLMVEYFDTLDDEFSIMRRTCPSDELIERTGVEFKFGKLDDQDLLRLHFSNVDSAIEFLEAAKNQIVKTKEGEINGND